MKRFSQNKNKRIRVNPIKIESAYYRNFKNKINEVKLKDIKEDDDFFKTVKQSKTAKGLIDDTKGAYVIKKTPGQRVKDSKRGIGYKIDSKCLGIQTDGLFYFETSSQTYGNKSYSQLVQLVNIDNAVENCLLEREKNKKLEKSFIDKQSILAINGEIKVYCSCVKRGTWIRTLDGWKRIETVTTEDFVLSSDGKFHKVYGLLKRDKNINKEKFCFKVKNSPFELNVTDDHEVLSFEITNEKIKKNKAKNLSIGSSLISSYPFFKEEEKKEEDALKYQCLGFYFASGFSFEDKICITVPEEENIIKVIELLKTCFDDIEECEIVATPYSKEKYDVVVKTKKYFSLCNEYVKIGNEQRILSNKLYQLNSNEVAGFLYGMHLCSEHVCNRRKKKSFITTNKIQQALEIQCLLNYCVLNKIINSFEIVNLKLKYKGETYRFYVSKVEKEKEQIKNENFVKNEIISKDIVENNDDYYDISLLEEPHDYMANGYFVSNCPAYLYWGWQYIDWKDDVGLKEVGFNGHLATRPKKNNVGLKGKVCKHLWNVLDTRMELLKSQVSSVIEERVKQTKPKKIKTKKTDIFDEDIQVEEGKEPLNVKNKEYKNKDLRKYKFIPGSVFTNCNFENSDFSGITIKDVKFINCKFYDVSFLGTKIISCVFNGSDVNKANFYTAKIKDSFFKNIYGNAIFTKALIKETDFSGSKLKNSTFINCEGEKVIFSDVDFTNSNLYMVKLKDSIFNDSDFTNVNMMNFKSEGSDFYRSKFIGISGKRLNMNKTNFGKSSNKNSSFREAVFEFVEGNDASFKESDFEGANINNSDFIKSNFFNVNMQRSIISLTRFNKSNLVGIRFQNSEMNKVALADADLKNANIIDVKGLAVNEFVTAKNIDSVIMTTKQKEKVDKMLKFLYDEKMKKLIYDKDNLNYMELKDVSMIEGKVIKDLRGKSFKNVKFKNINFSGCNLAGCQFENAILEGCKFIGANLRNVNFKKADVSKCNFSNSDVAEADFEDCNFYKNEIKNCNITKEQLVHTYNLKEYQKKYRKRFEQFTIKGKKKNFERHLIRNFWKIFKNKN